MCFKHLEHDFCVADFIMTVQSSAPFNEGEDHYIAVNFGAAVTLSMIRIWNYNKSRTHAYRGVRVVRLSLDDRVIFEGEILLASGVLDGVENCSEVTFNTKTTTAQSGCRVPSTLTVLFCVVFSAKGHSIYTRFRCDECHCEVR